MGEPAAAAPASAPANTTVTNEAANSGTWHASFDQDTKGWITGKGFDKLDAATVLPELVKGYRGAERTLGVPADQIIRLPGKEAKPEEMRAVYARLGMPEKVEGYEIKAPDGDDGAFLKTASGWFHELGMPKAMAQGLAGKWNEYAASTRAAADAAWNQRFDKELGELKSEWGDGYDKNLDLSNRVLRAAGFSREQQVALEQALGPKAFRQAFAKFGDLVGEHRFVGGDGQKNFAMSPEAAKARLVELRADGAWTSKMIEGDADKRAEWQRLHDVAFGTDPVTGPQVIAG